MSDIEFRSEFVPLDDVVVPRGRRKHTKEHIQALADSIQEVGLLNPITLTDEYKLVSGLGRLEAHRFLKRGTIATRIGPFGKLQAEVAEIDENIRRSNLSALEETKAIARRKEIYEELHPETKQHTAGGHAKANPATAKLAIADGFTEETSKNTGRSERSIRRDAEIGKKLGANAAEKLKDTPIEDNRQALKAIADLPPWEQEEVAAKVQAGEITKAKDIPKPKEKTHKTVDRKGNVIPAALLDRWNKALEFERINRSLIAIGKEVEELAKRKGIGEWLDYPVFAKDLDNLRSAMKFCKPYVVCPQCDGDGCPACRNTGWMPESPTTRNLKIA